MAGRPVGDIGGGTATIAETGMGGLNVDGIHHRVRADGLTARCGDYCKSDGVGSGGLTSTNGGSIGNGGGGLSAASEMMVGKTAPGEAAAMNVVWYARKIART